MPRRDVDRRQRAGRGGREDVALRVAVLRLERDEHVIVRRDLAECRIEPDDGVVAHADEEIEIVAVDAGGVLDPSEARVLPATRTSPARSTQSSA